MHNQRITETESYRAKETETKATFVNSDLGLLIGVGIVLFLSCLGLGSAIGLGGHLWHEYPAANTEVRLQALEKAVHALNFPKEGK